MKMEKKSKYHNNKRNIFVVLFFFIMICIIIIVMTGSNYKKYLNQGERTTCIKTVDYGKEGNEEGCITHYLTLTANYTLRYGLQYEGFQMKDKILADQKYLALAQTLDQTIMKTNDERKVSDVVRVNYFCDNQNQIYYIVQDNNMVYLAKGNLIHRNRNNRWFELIQVDYKVS